MTDEQILLLVAKAMTSGVKQEGATFKLPETMVIEFARLVEKRVRENITVAIQDYVEGSDRQWRDYAYELLDEVVNRRN